MNRASTDMGNVSQAAPAIHPYIGIDSLTFSQRLSDDHLVLELREDECGFRDDADAGGADGDVLEGVPALFQEGEACPFTGSERGVLTRVGG
jgi:hypothetical protein